MLFNSLSFLYAFLPVTYLVFWSLKSRDARYVWLTITGYVFYGFWSVSFCALMALSTLVSYLAGLGFLRFTDERRRRLCLVVPVVSDLLLLGFFKYANFTLESVRTVADFIHHPLTIEPLDIVLPVGISFYTFHTISYIVDCYRGTIRPTRNLFEFTCYVSLFCQLVAGPIVRFRQIEADLDHVGETKRSDFLDSGWSYFVLGLAKKVLVADTIASVVDPLLEHPETLSTATAWACALGYAYPLYFDFSGYSDMAVGLGRLFGLRLPQNFASPYKALDIAEFWRRWHMSLSSFLRDYLYIPLGGSRLGPLRTYVNLMITMLLGGLWHGANWTFVLWGGYHGLLLSLHRRFGGGASRVPAPVQALVTFVAVVFGWVMFRATDFAHLRAWLRSMFTAHDGASPPAWFFAAVAVAAVIAHGLPNTFELKHAWRPLPTLALAIVFVASVFMLYVGRESPFLYFQF